MINSDNSLQTPLVSVIIPAYNAEVFIQKTLNSVLTQTYVFFEIVIVDDGSQDTTAEIVEETAQKDSRVSLLQQKNAGVAAARNLGIKKSKGDLIALLDADDIWYPQYLEKSVQILLNSDPSVGVAYAWSIDIDEEDHLKGGFHVYDYEGDVLLRLLHRNFVGNASATVIRRQCFDKVGYYNENLRSQNAQGCEDWDLYLRISEFYQFRVVPEFLVGYRQVSISMSRNYEVMAKSQKLVLEYAQKRRPEIPESICKWSMSNFYVYLAHQNTYYHQYKEALSWLYQALLLDPTMVLIRHDLYLLVLLNLVQLLITPRKRFKNTKQPNFNLPSPRREITIKDIKILVTIHKWLPSRLYERIRLKKVIFGLSRSYNY